MPEKSQTAVLFCACFLNGKLRPQPQDRICVGGVFASLRLAQSHRFFEEHFARTLCPSLAFHFPAKPSQKPAPADIAESATRPDQTITPKSPHSVPATLPLHNHRNPNVVVMSLYNTVLYSFVLNGIYRTVLVCAPIAAVDPPTHSQVKTFTATATFIAGAVCLFWKLSNQTILHIVLILYSSTVAFCFALRITRNGPTESQSQPHRTFVTPRQCLWHPCVVTHSCSTLHCLQSRLCTTNLEHSPSILPLATSAHLTSFTDDSQSTCCSSLPLLAFLFNSTTHCNPPLTTCFPHIHPTYCRYESYPYHHYAPTNHLRCINTLHIPL